MLLRDQLSFERILNSSQILSFFFFFTSAISKISYFMSSDKATLVKGSVAGFSYISNILCYEGKLKGRF